MSEKPRVALIGAGAMGGALLRGWIAGDVIAKERSAIFDPAPSEALIAFCKAEGIAINPPIEGTTPDAIIVAVKPQVAGDVLGQYAPMARNAIIVSVMAGKSIARISEALGGADKIARTMPNLPASIGKGVSGIYANDAVTVDDRALIDRLMHAAGETVWVSSESEIDVVTSVSGSGPAYFFLLAEALAEAGAARGLQQDVAVKLARATLAGAGALMETDQRSLEAIRQAVTSPGGTTQAALNVFDGDEKALRKLVLQAVAAAAKRAGQLTD